MNGLFGRWLKFNFVGGLGIGVQLGALWVLTHCVHLDYLAATALAVETAVIHNFAWHERFTWKKRARGSMFGRFLRFQVANGLISGIDYVPRTWLRVGQVLGMKGVAKYRHLILPASLPSFISGLKQGWAFSWRSLMAGELLVIVPGALSIGVRMQQARDLSESSLVISFIIVVLVIGILIDMLFNYADNALRKRWGLTGN